MSKVEPQAQAVGELTRRGREGGRRGSDLLTQAGRFSREEPHLLRERQNSFGGRDRNRTQLFSQLLERIS